MSLSSPLHYTRPDLSALNSLTKYPSIPTYHEMGERGRLYLDLSTPLPEGPLYASEKVDGTNVRIIRFPDGQVLIGSREEFLWHSGDLLHNPALGIVDYFRDHPEGQRQLTGIRTHWSLDSHLTLVYGELYGHKIGAAAKEYTRTGQVSFRLFDIAQLDVDSATGLMAQDREVLARWREEPLTWPLRFHGLGSLQIYAAHLGLPLVPLLGLAGPLGPTPFYAEDLPTGLAETAAWLAQWCPQSQVTLDGAPGQPEGIVLRSADRGYIAKLRFADYARTLKGR
jgi:hypothetical protein